MGGQDPLEKEMAIQFNILAWKISRTGEPGRLQSKGSQRVRHDGVNNITKILIKGPHSAYVLAAFKDKLTTPLFLILSRKPTN